MSTSSPASPFLSPPPASANIPSPPAGFVPPKGIGTGRRAKTAELAYLPLAIAELKSFSDYAETLGKTAPAVGDVVPLFEVAAAWATMRKAAAAWDKYAAVQETVAWTGVRSQMATLKPAFVLAAKHDPSLATRFPNLTALLQAQSQIAKRGASVRSANKAAKARGEAAIHGNAGEKRRKAAEKAALAAEEASAHAEHAPAAAPAMATGPTHP